MIEVRGRGGVDGGEGRKRSRWRGEGRRRSRWRGEGREGEGKESLNAAVG